MKSYRVLVADDHPLARAAIHSLLENDSSFQLVGEAKDGQEAVQLCHQLQPDIVLMDIKMPHMNGLEATRHIKKAYPHIRVVMLSVSDDVGDLIAAIQFGAQGYLLKNLEPEVWLTYLHALLGEDEHVSRQLADQLFHRFHLENRMDEPGIDVLTPREQEILRCVASGETNRQIAERLFISENTVKNHIKNILEKLLLENRVQLAAYAARHGLSGK
jgi:two-component system, NarL family, nitrate/nitrite response regulator NarL